MKTVKVTFVLGALLVTGAVFASAQATSTPPAAGAQSSQAAPSGTPNGHHGRRGRGQLGMMTSTLNLSDDQVSQIKPILADRNTQLKALRADTSLAPADRRTKAKGIMDDSNSKITAVLNDQQKQLYSQMQENMKAHRAARKSKAAPAPAAAPSGL